jgi:type VI secretion system protein ImpC
MDSPPRASLGGTRLGGGPDETAMVTEGEALSEEERRLAEQLGQILDALPSQTRPTLSIVEALLSARIADLDAMLSAQLNEVLHAEEFQRLEASWRGLNRLVQESDTGSMLRVRVLNASKEDLRKDLESAIEFDQSALFHKVYEEEYGTLGGAPFGVLVGDYEFGRHPQDVALLERCSNVAAAAHAPLLAAASPALFGWDSFVELSIPRDLSKIFTGAEYAKWRSFRETEDSRYVALTLPRVLLREPYRADVARVESFDFAEDVEGEDGSKHLWGNAAYGLAICIANAFARYHWCAAIRGIDGGGLVDALPSPSFTTDDPELGCKGPTELALTDRREKELADIGLVPLVHCKGTPYAAFYSVQSCQKARSYDTDEANANARLSTQLQYILSTSRFAHYIKVMTRDKIGSSMTAQDCERFLQRWIINYCIANPGDVGPEARAERPLREARISVREVRGKPGNYEAVAHLQPHFQLDELNVALRLVAELPKPAQG